VANKESCRCECGYRCGGPGTCKLDVMDCLEKGDGKHFVRDCDHKFEGPLKDMGDGASSIVCSICDTSALGHDCVVGP